MRDAKHIMKTIGASICCVLSLAVITFFIYTVSITPPAAEPELYQISDNAFLDLFYRYLTSGIDLNPFIMLVGLIALLLEILFSNPLRFLFSQLPLGRILDSDKQMTVKERIIPSLLIGIAAAIDNTYEAVSPESFSEKVVLINWIALILIALSFLVQLGTLLSQGGIWRVLVSGSLLVIANLGCGALLGTIASALGILVAGFTMGFGLILFGIVVFLILSITTS